MTTPEQMVDAFGGASYRLGCVSTHSANKIRTERDTARDALIAALEEGERAKAEVAELRRKVFVPGLWKCPKCNFNLVQANLNGRDGTVTARDEPGDKCPNCDSPLWRVSEREAGNEIVERAEEYLKRATAAEADNDRLAAEVGGLRKIIDSCRWYWPEDRTDEDSCRHSPMDVCLDAGPGVVCAVSRGGVVETKYYAYLPAADDAVSDDEFEVDEATEADALAKLKTEIDRRAALAQESRDEEA